MIARRQCLLDKGLATGHIALQINRPGVLGAGLLIQCRATGLPENRGFALGALLAWHEVALLAMVLIGVAAQIE
ncbi:hypothetical protein D3C84_1183330 [compost metagenome]